jgi:hypothetical protein
MFSKLCQLNGGCMGCCGHSFVSKEKVKEAIKKNTQELELAQPKTESQFIKFRDRRPSMDLRDGVCRNLVDKGCIHCPLHPKRQKGKDLRVGHCDVNFLCKTAKGFANWNEEKKEKFLKFIESQGLDNIEYSLKMDNGSLLEEFNQMD